MPLKVKYDDVTTYKVDAIVNSLGVYGNVYGKLCKNIITKAKDDELKAFIDKQNNPIGTVLVTGAGNLNCKNIIHVVTPFKKDDDENNSLLIKAYKDCLNKALELGHKSIAMPFIGTGANGYSDAEAFESIGSACEDVLAKEEKEDKDIIYITIVGYLSKRNRNYRRDEYEQIDGCVPYRYQNEILNEQFQVLKRNYNRNNSNAGEKGTFKKSVLELEKYITYLNNINPNDLLVPNRKYIYPFDFFDDFVEQTKFSKVYLAKLGFDRKRRYKLRNSEHLSKKDIYRLSFILELNYSQILQWMFIAGHSFSPLDPLDRFFVKYLNDEYIVDSFFEFTQLCFDETKEVLTF